MSNSLSPPFFLNSTHSPQLHPVTGEQLAGVSRDGRAPPPPSGLSPQASTRSAHRTPRLPPAPAERENSLSPAEPPPSRAAQQPPEEFQSESEGPHAPRSLLEPPQQGPSPLTRLGTCGTQERGPGKPSRGWIARKTEAQTQGTLGRRSTPKAQLKRSGK